MSRSAVPRRGTERAALGGVPPSVLPDANTCTILPRHADRPKLPCLLFLTVLPLLVLAGCSKSPGQDNPSVNSTRTAETLPVKPVPPDDSFNGPESMQADGIKTEVETALADKNSVLPKGAKLNSAEIKAGVLTLDFDAGFNQAANMGESGESDVQKELMRIAAAHGAVQKMRVTVNGKPFDSQATDWNTPFAVSSAGNADKSKAGQ